VTVDAHLRAGVAATAVVVTVDAAVALADVASVVGVCALVRSGVGGTVPRAVAASDAPPSSIATRRRSASIYTRMCMIRSRDTSRSCLCAALLGCCALFLELGARTCELGGHSSIVGTVT
jgi:hypothetical protein